MCALPTEDVNCWPSGWPQGTFTTYYNLSVVGMNCSFADAAPLLTAGAAATCNFADALQANVTLRTAYGASTTAVVADFSYDATARDLLSTSFCDVLGRGGACLLGVHAPPWQRPC